MVGAGASSVSRARWESLIDALLAESEVMVEAIRRQMRLNLPSYKAVSDEDLTPGICREVDSALGAARSGYEQISDSELAEVAKVGELRARQGVALDELLLAWRIGVQVVLKRGTELAGRLGIEATEMLEFVRAFLASSDRAMAIVADAHRGAELQLARQEQETRAQLVKGILLGTLPPQEMRTEVAACGMEPDISYITVRARPSPSAGPVELERMLGFRETVLPRGGLSAVIDGDLWGLSRSAPRRQLPAAVGLGPARPLEGLAESFRLATRALVTAQAFDLLGSYSVEKLGVLPAVVDDVVVGDALCRRYLDPLASSTVEIAASLRAFFESEMQVERAAEQIFVHPNTLRYRIARFEELTGASLRDPKTAFEVWWALERARLRDDTEARCLGRSTA